MIPGQNDSTKIERAGRRIRRELVRLLPGLWLGLAAVVSAQEGDPGLFVVRSASTELRGGVYYLDARIGLRLSSEAREALDSGVPLTIRFEIEFLNRLRIWWDLEEQTLRQEYELEYHALTERYLVRNLNSGDLVAYSTVSAAMAAIGTINDLPLIDETVLDADRRYDVRVRALLDIEHLPGPLRLIAFWRRDWTLGSEWYRWRLDPE